MTSVEHDRRESELSSLRCGGLKLFQSLNFLPVCGSMSCQMVGMGLLRM
jgi:hypothetical protein